MAIGIDAPDIPKLKDLTGFDPWLETERGKKAEAAYALRMKICLGVQLLLPTLVVGYMFTFLTLDWGMAVLMAVLWIALFVISGRVLRLPRSMVTNMRHRARKRYSGEIAANYAPKESFDHFCSDDADVSVMFWSPKGYAILSPMVENALIMPIANLLETRIDHVQIGSTTVTHTKSSGSGIGIGIGGGLAVGFGGGRGKSKGVTTNHYEWRLDLLNDFDPLPSMTFVFPDNAEDRAKVAYATLTAGKKRHDTGVSVK